MRHEPRRSICYAEPPLPSPWDSCAPRAHGTVINVAVMDSTFLPPLITAASGDSIVWTSVGSLLHAVTSQRPGGIGRAFDQSLAPGQVFTWVVPNVPRPARLSYLCRFHVAMGMRGAIDLVP